ncbi:MAG: helix-turn-helix domain-containing protein [Solirubrobacterales bacterium]|nr:helix-turn-helix domain-containing protein [Solirubrobacterales bacterium]
MDLSWLEPEPPPPDADVVADSDPTAGEDAPSETALSMSLTTPRPEADDDVHFGVAARALGVSRKTVERMVKRGQLERGPSNAPATVSKRSLVAALEGRRRDVRHLTRATEIERAGSGTGLASRDSPDDPQSALREVLLPVLAPLLDEFVAVRTRAAVLEDQLDSIKARAAQERKRDQLLFALLTSGWWGRRKTRRAVLQHYIVGDDRSDPGSEAE